MGPKDFLPATRRMSQCRNVLRGRAARRIVPLQLQQGRCARTVNRGEATRHPTSVINRPIDNRRRATMTSGELPAASWSNRASTNSGCSTSSGKST